MVKKVLIFSLAYGPRFWGGAEIAVKEITDRIAPESISFDMITLRFDSTLPREEKMGNILIHRIGFSAKNPDVKDLSSFPLLANKYLFPFLAFWKAVSLHRKNRYGATWAIMANYAGFAALFFKLAYPKIFYLLTLQEGDPIPYIKHRVRFVYPLFRRIFTKADTVQAISCYLAEFGREMGAREPIAIIPNGVDTALFREKKERYFPGLNEGPKTLVTASRLVKKNAIGDIMEALLFLPPDVRLFVLGIGPLERELKEKAESLGVKERVLFVGYKPHTEMIRYFDESHIFVRPALSEGMGNSFLEAMAAGLPVIATPVGGIPDFLRHEETGLFCEVKNPRSIARQVARLFADRMLREKIIVNARRQALTRYNWNTISHQFEACLPFFRHRAEKTECDATRLAFGSPRRTNVAHANKNVV
ncbi:MAG: glycosyltransferase [Parcubacteria group bacterium]|nr:glycosyltransferase [Parcubacteria group bacterium]